MENRGQLFAAAGCERCPARPMADEPGVRVRSAILVPSRRVLQATGRTRAVVLKSVDHGSFLVRRRKDRTGHACPLLDYEVSRLSEGGRPGPEPDPNRAPRSEDSRGTRAACRELLMLFLAGLV